MTGKERTTNEIEAANRAEVTAILIRSGNSVYRPEADAGGEDLVIRRPDSDVLLLVQMKSRPMVHWSLYGGHNIWMLFPDPTGEIPGRTWFLIEHDVLFAWFKDQHGAKSSGWTQRSNAKLSEWSERRISRDLGKFLERFKLPLPSHSTKDKRNS